MGWMTNYDRLSKVDKAVVWAFLVIAMTAAPFIWVKEKLQSPRQ